MPNSHTKVSAYTTLVKAAANHICHNMSKHLKYAHSVCSTIPAEGMFCWQLRFAEVHHYPPQWKMTKASLTRMDSRLIRGCESFCLRLKIAMSTWKHFVNFKLFAPSLWVFHLHLVDGYNKRSYKCAPNHRESQFPPLMLYQFTESLLVSEKQTGRCELKHGSTCCHSSIAVIVQQELICSSGLEAY